jgi:hypothetical protein
MTALQESKKDKEFKKMLDQQALRGKSIVKLDSKCDLDPEEDETWMNINDQAEREIFERYGRDRISQLTRFAIFHHIRHSVFFLESHFVHQTVCILLVILLSVGQI